MDKPKLGEWFNISHTLRRETEKSQRIWRPYPSFFYSRKPSIKAMFIGYRYFQDGIREWEDLGEGGIYIFTPSRRYLVYQFVYANNRKPIFALPIHCQKIEGASDVSVS